MRRFSALSLSAFSVLAAALVGCTNSTDYNGNSTTAVTEITAGENPLSVGEQVVFYFDFEFDENDVFSGSGEVNLVVVVPPQLSYVLNTSEISGLSGDDTPVIPYVTRCLNGFTYLQFNLNDTDLQDSYSPSGDAEAQLTMTLVGRQDSDYVVVEASALDGYIAFGCNQDFVADETDIVQVF